MNDDLKKQQKQTEVGEERKAIKIYYLILFYFSSFLCLLYPYESLVLSAPSHALFNF